MRLYTIEVSGRELAALELCDGKLYPVTDLGFPYNTMLELIRCGKEEDLAKLRDLAASESASGEFEGKGFDKEAVAICSPIPESDQDIVCLGLNYNAHILETTHVEAFREKGLEPKIEYEIYDDYSILGMIRRGFGISIQVGRILRGFEEGLAVRKIEDAPVRSVSLMWRNRDTMPLAARAFMDHIVLNIGELASRL